MGVRKKNNGRVNYWWKRECLCIAVNSDGSINVSGVDITIGSLAVSLESIYVTSGTMYMVSGDNLAVTSMPKTEVYISGAVVTGSNFWVNETTPIDTTQNNAFINLLYVSSGTSTGITTGSQIGSIVKFIDAGSYVKVLTYTSDNLSSIGSWS